MLDKWYDDESRLGGWSDESSVSYGKKSSEGLGKHGIDE